MSSFKFRLDPLLKLREYELRLAEGELMQCRHCINELKKIARDLTQEYQTSLDYVGNATRSTVAGYASVPPAFAST